MAMVSDSSWNWAVSILMLIQPSSLWFFSFLFYLSALFSLSRTLPLLLTSSTRFFCPFPYFLALFFTFPSFSLFRPFLSFFAIFVFFFLQILHFLLILPVCSYSFSSVTLLLMVSNLFYLLAAATRSCLVPIQLQWQIIIISSQPQISAKTKHQRFSTQNEFYLFQDNNFAVVGLWKLLKSRQCWSGFSAMYFILFCVNCTLVIWLRHETFSGQISQKTRKNL